MECAMSRLVLPSQPPAYVPVQGVPEIFVCSHAAATPDNDIVMLSYTNTTWVGTLRATDRRLQSASLPGLDLGLHTLLLASLSGNWIAHVTHKVPICPSKTVPLKLVPGELSSLRHCVSCARPQDGAHPLLDR